MAGRFLLLTDPKPRVSIHLRLGDDFGCSRFWYLHRAIGGQVKRESESDEGDDPAGTGQLTDGLTIGRDETISLSSDSRSLVE